MQNLSPKLQRIAMIGIVLLGVIVISILDAIVHPPYLVKSLIKIVLFLGLPLLYSHLFHPQLQLSALFRLSGGKKALRDAALWGIGIFALIIGAYAAIGHLFDFSQFTHNLETSMGITRQNFIFVVLYISFCNSLLEEFFFRGFACLKLQTLCSKRFAYLFSAVCFALYHTAMMWVAFDPALVFLALAGLVVGGFIFSYFNEKYGNLYISWLIHMGANFAINGIGVTLMYAN